MSLQAFDEQTKNKQQETDKNKPEIIGSNEGNCHDSAQRHRRPFTVYKDARQAQTPILTDPKKGIALILHGEIRQLK